MTPEMLELLSPEDRERVEEIRHTHGGSSPEHCDESFLLHTLSTVLGELGKARKSDEYHHSLVPKHASGEKCKAYTKSVEEALDKEHAALVVACEQLKKAEAERDELRSALEGESSDTESEMESHIHELEAERDALQKKYEYAVTRVVAGHRQGSMSCWDVSNLTDSEGRYHGLWWRLLPDACEDCKAAGEEGGP